MGIHVPRGPCYMCPNATQCKDEFLACTLFLRFCGETFRGVKPNRVPARRLYLRAFPGDRMKVMIHDLKKEQEHDDRAEV